MGLSAVHIPLERIYQIFMRKRSRCSGQMVLFRMIVGSAICSHTHTHSHVPEYPQGLARRFSEQHRFENTGTKSYETKLKAKNDMRFLFERFLRCARCPCSPLHPHVTGSKK